VGVASLPPPSKALLEQGARLRNKLGHYLGGTLYFEGEWYWGVDRLHYLEKRLGECGLSSGATSHAPLFAPPVLQYRPVTPRTGAAPVIHFYCSLRSPYTYLAAAQVRALAAHYGATLQLRFVLPMVMRGLPVPLAKRLYILRDAKREAKRLGIDFGCVVDPVGKPVEQGLALLYAAVEQGCGPQLLESFLQGVFADGIDAGSAQGLQRIAKRAGMQAVEVQQALRNEAWRVQAESNRADMFARGVWGVPAFRVDERPALWGQDRLWMLEEDLLSVLSER
jgi:2-hydroxychromene-2-carboxylate isomerase